MYLFETSLIEWIKLIKNASYIEFFNISCKIPDRRESFTMRNFEDASSRNYIPNSILMKGQNNTGLFWNVWIWTWLPNRFSTVPVRTSNYQSVRVVEATREVFFIELDNGFYFERCRIPNFNSQIINVVVWKKNYGVDFVHEESPNKSWSHNDCPM